jgi:cell division protein FtsZ
MNILFLGGFGISVLEYFSKNKLLSPNHQYYLLNADKQALTKADINKNNLPNLNIILLFENEEYLLSLLDKNDINIFVAGLAGITGNRLCGSYSNIVKKHNYKACFIVTTPFEFEGKKKKEVADNIINEIEAKKILIIENKNLHNLIGRKTSIKEAFGLIYKCVHWVIEKIENHPNITINELTDDEKKYLGLFSWEALTNIIENTR